GATRGVGARDETSALRPRARRVSTGAGKARAHGDRPDRRAPAHLPRGLGKRPRRGAGDAAGGDGEGVRDRGCPADRGRRRADPGGPRGARVPPRGPPVPRGPGAADLRGHDGDPAPHRGGAAPQAGGRMRVVVLGGGPAGLYFAIQMKKADASHHVTVIERNPLDATFGFGVVFSDATQDNLAEADRETHEEMARQFHHWEDIDVHFNGTVVTSTGSSRPSIGAPTATCGSAPPAPSPRSPSISSAIVTASGASTRISTSPSVRRSSSRPRK